jgi:hypothetical protein
MKLVPLNKFNLVILIILQLTVMENMSQSNELEDIEVELDNTLSINPTPDQPVNTTSPAVGETGDGSVSVTSENPLYKKKERQKTAKVWNDFDSITLSGGVKKSQCRWCKRLFAVGKSSTTSTLNRHLTSCSRYIEHNSSKKQKTLSFEPSSEHDGVESLVAFSYKESKVRVNPSPHLGVGKTRLIRPTQSVPPRSMQFFSCLKMK